MKTWVANFSNSWVISENQVFQAIEVTSSGCQRFATFFSLLSVELSSRWWIFTWACEKFHLWRWKSAGSCLCMFKFIFSLLFFAFFQLDEMIHAISMGTKCGIYRNRKILWLEIGINNDHNVKQSDSNRLAKCISSEFPARYTNEKKSSIWNHEIKCTCTNAIC